jgi:GDP-L-fucose synthase
MPTNLYGKNDNFDLKTSHVLPALLRKFHDAKHNNENKVEIWGSGNPKREFLHVDDLADACVFLMNNYNKSETINVGTGVDISIKDLALLIKKITGFKGDLEWNSSMPDGTYRKLLDVSKIHNLQWKAKINLTDGIKLTYDWYIKNHVV